MATQIKLNKASLTLEQRNLKNYQRFLPSLELKRKNYCRNAAGLMFSLMV